jgi:transcription termination factor Rho
VTETDLITAGSNENENVELPNTVKPDTSTPAEADASATTPTAETAPTADVASGNRRASLSTMVLPELRALAKEVGVEGASGMRKSELVAAIRERRGASNGRAATDTGANGATTPAEKTEAPAEKTEAPAEKTEARADKTEARAEKTEAPADAPETPAATAERPFSEVNEKQARRERRGASRDAGEAGAAEQKKQDTKVEGEKATAAQPDTKPARGDQQQGDQQQGDQQGGQNRGDDDGEGRGGRRGRRFRDRRRRERGGEGGGGGDRDTELREDDVVQPVAGILDVLDNYAFVRTSGYLAGPNDVYVSMNMVRKNGLRRGDAITGAVRVPKDGEQPNQRQKFNPLVRLDTVNGGPVEDAKKRPDFTKLTPLYPNQRLRLETTPERLTTRVIDLIMPIGKGQRALIVSPPKAGKTTILQDIANGVTKNNPECHLMVVLVDERPEEVTDMQRSVKGEVIASTFDRPPSDHTQAAELAIERAKRLVEQGKDVIVLLDSITRLGRAYNNASPASGRILSGGVDSTALYPPKRFLGAARNIEDGGSLTIIATAMVETGSTGDTVIFEEFKGTGNAELKLDRKISERRVFPAVDVNPSGTRKDELLLSADEFAVVHKLRRVLSGLDPHQAIDLLMSQLRKTKTNYEFLVQVSKTAPGNMDSD